MNFFVILLTTLNPWTYLYNLFSILQKEKQNICPKLTYILLILYYYQLKVIMEKKTCKTMLQKKYYVIILSPILESYLSIDNCVLVNFNFYENVFLFLLFI